MKNSVKKISEIINQSNRIVVISGAGISTQSGISDYRGTDGIWSKYKPIPYDEFITSREARVESWQRKGALYSELKKAQPNLSHRAVAYLKDKGLLKAVVTQNVDGLHQASGIESESIIELHGNATKAACVQCNKNFALQDVLDEFEVSKEPPICDACGGFVKTATISFGQAMSQRALMNATDAARSCDLFLVLGSSLVVYPAANLPLIAKDNGAVLVIINYQSTAFDTLADVVMHDEIGGVLGQVLNFS